MTRGALKTLLEKVKNGTLSVDKGLLALKDFPLVDLGFATVDTHRELRSGFPEVIWAQHKTTQETVRIAKTLAKKGSTLLVTRASVQTGKALKKAFAKGEWHERARIFRLLRKKNFSHLARKNLPTVGIVCAGTSDLPVADEAALTAECHNVNIIRINDVGVAGIHRLLAKRADIQSCDVLVCVAGMEGALPTAVGGLVDVPVVAVPTSVGYGAHLNGVAALLSMLNSCTPNVAVVNIDNGFGAGHYAALIAEKQHL